MGLYFGTILFLCLTSIYIESRVLLEFTAETVQTSTDDADEFIDDDEADHIQFDPDATHENGTFQYARAGVRRVVNVKCNPPSRRTRSGQCRVPV